MRRFARILCMLLNVSVALMPFNTVHAHVSASDEHQTGVHQGHSHDIPHGHDHAHAHDVPAADHAHDGDPAEPADTDRVVDLKPVLTSQKDSGASSVLLLHRVPLPDVVAVLADGTEPSTALLRPPQSTPQFASQRAHWRPPLRGPPAASIPVR